MAKARGKPQNAKGLASSKKSILPSLGEGEMHSAGTPAKSLQQALLRWYRANRRDLPWRGEADPYRILLSEVLLQQTRVDQAIPYYRRFLHEFPSLLALAEADPERVLKAWEGCGYYARARNLHKLARLLLERRAYTRTSPGVSLPTTYAELLELPGLGPYTAAALASIAFGQPVAAVDGNVRRVVSRWEAWETPSPKQVQAKADAVLARESPGDWNQAMMELGATLCTPKSPACPHCPVVSFCQGKANPERYPAARPRKQQSVEAVALVLMGPDGVYLEERTGRILGGLWGFPMEEGGAAEPLLERLGGASSPEYLGLVSHAFTHRKLAVRVYRANWQGAGFDPRQKPLSRLDQKILALARAAVQEPLLGHT